MALPQTHSYLGEHSEEEWDQTLNPGSKLWKLLAANTEHFLQVLIGELITKGDNYGSSVWNKNHRESTAENAYRTRISSKPEWALCPWALLSKHSDKVKF